MKTREMKTPLAAGEEIVHQGPANMQRGIEAVGGWLFLTNRSLVFESHRLNVQTGATEIPMTAIVESGPCWTRFLGLIPLMPNSIFVQTHNSRETFVVWGRQTWLDQLDVIKPGSETPG